MASKSGKVKTRVRKKALDIETVQDLGGDKTDVELLKGVDDEEDEIIDNFEDDQHTDSIKREEILDFIRKLGITEQFKEQDEEGKEKKEKKKKLKSMPEINKEVDEEKPKVPETKKKQKNKYKIQHDEISSTTDSLTDTPTVKKWNLKSHLNTFKPRSYLLIKPGQDLFDEEVPDHFNSCSSDLESQLENFASKLLEDEVSVYNKQREKTKKSDTMWIKTVLSTGTLTDKIAALTLLVQESPLHNLHNLESLINMAKKKGKRECMSAADTLKELFVNYLLPEDRKLASFHQHPFSELEEVSGGNRDTVDKKLLKWYYEFKLKENYMAFIATLEVMSKDNILATRQKALSIFYELLVSKPEQEKTLLALLVNKVGDPEYKLAAEASHFLSKIVDVHPNMKLVVVKEVERLLYRPNIPPKAQYYCICFVNRLLLSHEEKELAAKLIQVYFSFFKTFVKNGEIDSRMMSGLLTGVNRAFPYAKVDSGYISEQMDTLYRIIHIVNFNTSIQALMLIYQVMDSSESISDRYYTALYKKMTEPGLKNNAKQAMFLNLLFRSLKKDIVERRVKAFVKRLLQVCSYQPVHFICGALVLLGELVQVQPTLLLSDHVAFDESDDEEEHFTDLPAPDDSEGSDAQEEDHKVVSKSSKPSWVHKSNRGGSSTSTHYDPLHRNPLYCRADTECIWELRKLSHHFHPTVSLFASNLLKGEKVSYSGDPLQDFTTKRFLDRFVYKNPKKKEALTEMKGTLSRSKFIGKTGRLKGVKGVAVNSEKYLAKTDAEVPVEEHFFHRFFTQKAEWEGQDKRNDDDADSTSDVSDSEFDAFLDDFEKNLEGKDVDLSQADVDFASAVGMKPKKKGQGVMYESDDDDDDDNDDNENLSDEEVDFGLHKDFADEFKEFDEDINDAEERPDDEEEMSDDDYEDEFAPMQTKKTESKGAKRKVMSAADEIINKKSKRSGRQVGLFASAEEFADILEESASSGWKTLGSSAMSNKDNANVKQLQWEEDRNQWLKGHKKRGKKFNKGRPHVKTGGKKKFKKGKRK